MFQCFKTHFKTTLVTTNSTDSICMIAETTLHTTPTVSVSLYHQAYTSGADVMVDPTTAITLANLEKTKPLSNAANFGSANWDLHFGYTEATASMAAGTIVLDTAVTRAVTVKSAAAANTDASTYALGKLTALPTIVAAADPNSKSDNGLTYTVTATYQITASNGANDSFVANGKLFSAALYTFNQANACAFVGAHFEHEVSSSQVDSASVGAVKPTISTTQSVYQQQGRGQTKTTWTATPAKPSGITAATVEVSWVTQTSKTTGTMNLQLEVMQSSTFAPSDANTEIQQMTCLRTWNTAPKQYLCFIAKHVMANGTNTSNTATSQATQYVYQTSTDLAVANFGSSGTMTTKLTSSTGILTANNKAIQIYEASSASGMTTGQDLMATIHTQPNYQFVWPSGTYWSSDRTKCISRLAWAGSSSGSTKAEIDDATTSATAGLVKAWLATGTTGQTLTGGSTTGTVSVATVFSAKTASTCTTMTEATCKSTYTLVKSGALSTIATVGAAIAAMAMSF